VSEKPKVQQVEVQQIQIDPDGRYLLLVKGLPSEALVLIKEQFDKWWESGNPVMFVSIAPDVEVKFVRVNDEQESD
jgi:hypothetical protein